MIAPNDLHHGCYYQIEGEMWQLNLDRMARYVNLNDGRFSIFIDEDRAKDFEPITLTPESIRALGFYVRSDTLIQLPESDFPLGRWITLKNFMSDEKLDRPFLRYDDLKDVFFVHELQMLAYGAKGIILTWNTAYQDNGPVK